MHVCFGLLAATVWESMWIRPIRPLRVLAMLLGVTCFLLFEFWLSFCLALDYLFFPGWRRTEVKAPVFIIGNPRSGTTHLHRLMALDEERFTTFPAHELFFPAVTQQWLLRLFDRMDPYLGSPFRRLRERIERRVFAPRDAMHRLRFNEPEEDDNVVVHKFASPVLLAMFGKSTALVSRFRFDEAPSSFRRDVTEFYRACLQRHLYWAGRGRTLLSKNPTFPLKVRTIKEAFPDCRFVYILRNPAVAIASIHSMFVTGRARWGAATPPPEQVRRMYDNLCYMYRHAFEELERMPQSDVCIVEYEKLVADPRAVVHEIYDRLQLPRSEAFERRLDEATAAAKRYTSRHLYSLEPVGVTADDVRAALPVIYDRFQFEERVAEAEPATHVN
uniref:Sulfotransferase n=1 Tax=Schlesneria paludicola TaxID=360056 RepID=A0A7C2NYN8_9PLAN